MVGDTVSVTVAGQWITVAGITSFPIEQTKTAEASNEDDQP